MELNKKLVMTFKTTDDKKVSISVDNPREDLAALVSAKVVQTDTTNYDLVF